MTDKEDGHENIKLTTQLSGFSGSIGMIAMVAVQVLHSLHTVHSHAFLMLYRMR